MAFEPVHYSENSNDHRYIKYKCDKAREEIKMLIGEYLSKCKEYKYDILESFMKGIIFDERFIRESYIQEVLFSL